MFGRSHSNEFKEVALHQQPAQSDDSGGGGGGGWGFGGWAKKAANLASSVVFTQPQPANILFEVADSTERLAEEPEPAPLPTLGDKVMATAFAPRPFDILNQVGDAAEPLPAEMGGATLGTLPILMLIGQL